MSYLLDHDVYCCDDYLANITDVFSNNLCRSDHYVVNALQHKRFIKETDHCSICMANIGTVNDAYLTDCGHTFHNRCLSNYSHFLQFNKHELTLSCPLCRTKLGAPQFHGSHYYSEWGRDFNGFDEIENMSNPNNFNDMVHICHDANNKSHYLGNNKNCVSCQNYISGK